MRSNTDQSFLWPGLVPGKGLREMNGNECGYNQSMVQPLTKAGNFNDRIWKVSPIGEKQMTTWRFSLTRSRNQLSVFSGVGGSRGHSLFMIGASSVTISPWFNNRHVNVMREYLFILAEDLGG